MRFVRVQHSRNYNFLSFAINNPHLGSVLVFLWQCAGVGEGCIYLFFSGFFFTICLCK